MRRGGNGLSINSSLLQQLLWPRDEVGDNCTVVMATTEPHTLTLNRSTTLLGGAKEGRAKGDKILSVVCVWGEHSFCNMLHVQVVKNGQ